MQKKGKQTLDRVSIAQKRRFNEKLDVYRMKYQDHQNLIPILKKQKDRIMESIMNELEMDSNSIYGIKNF